MEPGVSLSLSSPKRGGEGTRTPNPLLAKQMRYQLRHAPALAENRYEVLNGIRRFLPGLTDLLRLNLLEAQKCHDRDSRKNKELFHSNLSSWRVGVPRLELGTSSLSAKRSNRLSYTPSHSGGILRKNEI